MKMDEGSNRPGQKDALLHSRVPAWERLHRGANITERNTYVVGLQLTGAVSTTLPWRGESEYVCVAVVGSQRRKSVGRQRRKSVGIKSGKEVSRN